MNQQLENYLQKLLFDKYFAINFTEIPQFRKLFMNGL